MSTQAVRAVAPADADIVDEALLASRAQRRNRLLTLASFATMVGFWAGITGSGLWPPLVDPVFLPSPVEVVRTFIKLLNTGYQGRTLGHHFMVSLMRFGLAFGICIVIGVPVGLLMGMNRAVQAALDPPVEITRPIPKLALLPLFIIWFGIASCRRRSSSPRRCFR